MRSRLPLGAGAMRRITIRNRPISPFLGDAARLPPPSACIPLGLLVFCGDVGTGPRRYQELPQDQDRYRMTLRRDPRAVP